MQIRWFLTGFLIIVLSAIVIGQTSVVFGVVRDIDTNKGIDYVTVYVDGTSNATESDNNGQYKIVVEQDKKITLKFSRLGYSDLTVSVEAMISGQKRNINVKMVPKASDLEIVVRAGKIEDVGMVREDVTELKILPTASGNFESVLPHIALGVSAGAGGELTSQYNVRGGNYDENLIYVNDFEIFRPQLIRSGQQEGLSFPNIDMIRDLEFSSGGFESKYGDKMSSVLDIRYKRPEDFRASVTASLLGASAHFEGSKRIGANAYNKFRYLVGARYKTNAYLLGSSDIKGEYVPSFTDIQAFLSYEITKEFQVGLIANYNGSQYNFQPSSGKSKKGTIDFQLELNTLFEGQESDNFRYGMGGISLTYVPERKKNPLYMKLLASSYKASEEEKFDILGYYRLSQIETSLGDNTGQEIAVLGTGTQHTYTRNFLYNTIYNIEYKGGLELQTSKSGSNEKLHFIQWGLKYQSEEFDDKLNEWERLDSAGYSLPYREEEIQLSRVLKSQNIIRNDRVQVFLQDGFTIKNANSELKISGGIRGTYRSLSDEIFVSPRVQLLFKPLQWKNDISFKLAGGIYNQVPLYREMRRPDGSINTELKSQKSTHIVAGLSYDFTWEKVSNRPFRIISEIYYKKLTDMVSYELDNVRIRYAGENNSTGYIVGWDFRINGEFVPGAESWINFSFLSAREKLNGINHLRYEVVDSVRVPVIVNDVPRPTDQLMTINMFFQDYLPRNENVKVNLNFSVGTGLPYGPRENNTEFRNFFRLKPYHRIDVGFSFQLWKAEWIKRKPNHPLRFAQNSWISLEAFNLLQISNQASVNWIKTLTNEEYALPNNLTGRRINVRLRIDF
ncbi:MAG: TonB-dependent receptor [Saprospiraceae bacterium]|nr:TonB-dependent receptor [Saprospiraceae bacterium]